MARTNDFSATCLLPWTQKNSGPTPHLKRKATQKNNALGGPTEFLINRKFELTPFASPYANAFWPLPLWSSVRGRGQFSNAFSL